MPLRVDKQTIEVQRLIGDASWQSQVTAETAVPGAGREPAEVLMEAAEASIDTAEAQTDRVVLGGVVTCQAVYRQGEHAARAVAAQTNLNEVIDIPGVTAKSIVRARAIVEAVEAEYDNGRMRFLVTIALRVQAFALDSVELVGALEGVEGLRTKTAEVCSGKLAAESRAETTLTEEVALPTQLDARVALMDWASARVTSVEPDLGGVRVKGEAQAEALIGTGVPARPAALVKVQLPFDQLVELPEWLVEDVTAEARVRRTTAVIDAANEEEDATLKLECVLAIDVQASARDCVSAVADAYGIGDQTVALKTQTLTLCAGSEAIDCNEPFRGTLLLPDGAPGVGTVLATRVTPVVSGWSDEGGDTRLEGALDIKAIYLPGGGDQIAAARGELPFTMRCAGVWPQDAWVTVEATTAEASALMSDRLEIRCTLRASGAYRTCGEQTIVTDAEAVDQAARPCGLIVVWPSAEDTAWSVAKRYALPEEVVGSVQAGEAVVLRS